MDHSSQCVTVLKQKLHHKEEITGNVQKSHVTRAKSLLTDKHLQVNKWLGNFSFEEKSNPCRSTYRQSAVIYVIWFLVLYDLLL